MKNDTTKEESQYKALKNHIHNTLGITKEDIRAWTKKAVEDIVSRKVQVEVPTKDIIERMVVSAIEDMSNVFWGASDDSFDDYIKKEVVKELLHGVKLKVEIAKTKKESTPLTNVKRYGSRKQKTLNEILKDKKQ